MSLRRFAVLSLVAALALPSAVFAQETDDLIAPPSEDTPAKPKGKPKAVKPKPTVKRKPPAPKKERVGKKTKPGKTPAVSPVDAPEAAKSALAFRLGSNARGAKITVDDVEVNPLEPVELAPGEHRVLARRQGYSDFLQRVVVSPGQTTDVTVALEVATGIATLRADVPRATVLVDGVKVGVTPLENYAISPGQHEVEFRAPGLKDVKNIVVRAGQPYLVEGRLRPVADSDVPRNAVLEPAATPAGPVEQPGLALGTEQPPEVKESTSTAWYQRWYVWVGVGVVAAAAGAGAYAATRPPAALNPDVDVCGGKCDGTIGAGLRSGMPAGALRF
ncbi:PEGA domain-containing protein [Corallococcus praedator]|uniref:PEGA domain-containing protein n=1 Tax=Corallococcus praedator TaxID=2316724 RepID=A0ABX9Q8N1_9BACT|nr:MULTISPECIES: PEGA domain-containing protein [Corallococcus]RKH21113.1 PEGA domain-containing protein [Corallococcus sp. CA031C]RKH93929.1 PEGA domain-containing protein [Corallococcus praedator]